MSAHTFIEINGRLLLACRESYVPDLATLFAESELQSDDKRLGYVSTVYAMRDRLQMHGFTAVRARAELDRVVRAWRSECNPVKSGPLFDNHDVPGHDSVSILSELGNYVNSTDEWMAYEEPEHVFWRLDSRTILRLAVDLVADGNCSLRYNLDDLQSYEMIIPPDPISDQAREDRKAAISSDAPLVILTEGSTDSQLLTEAIQVTHPHLVGFVRFMDFGNGAQGSAGDLAKLVRSFAAAGIANRVLALADNDTAAYDALDKVKRDGLPEGYRVVHYPHLPLLTQYPTLGPQLADPVLMNVNGKAGSLEMYLGRELLTENGDLTPVQWTGYVDGQKSYQGAIAKSAKKRIQSDFRKKVKAALQDPTLRTGQDWSGVEAIVHAILTAFDKPSRVEILNSLPAPRRTAGWQMCGETVETGENGNHN